MRTIAFYLPQFHAIPENDEWWGEGFTEWVNVRRAQPQHAGHLHPRLTGPLGEYDLTDKTIMREQSRLAREHGIDAFCMYFYWFSGRRLLETPVEAWREDDELLPYCLSWANESWTRRWDGKEKEVLMPQNYEPGYAEDVFDAMFAHFKAPHYLRHDGKPIVVIHRADVVPNARAMVEIWRERAVAAGLSGIYVVAAETTPGLDPSAFGMDGVVEFPPVGANTFATAYLRPLAGVRRNFRGRLMSYERLATSFERRPQPPFTRHRGVAPGWDNTARRQSAATIYVGSTPERYANWLQNARRSEHRERGDDGMVFINAWNEWAEGAYLEPDAHHGAAYLEATRGTVAPIETRRPQHRAVWSAGHLRSLALALAGSLLAIVRRFRNRYR